MIDLTRKNWLLTPSYRQEEVEAIRGARELRQRIEKAAYSVMAYAMINDFSSEEGLFATDPQRWHIERARFWAGQQSVFEQDAAKRDDLLERIAAQGFDEPGLLALVAERVMFEGRGLTAGSIVAKIKTMRSESWADERS